MTLQFKWIQLQYPAVVMAFERLLLAGCVPVGSVVITWGLLPASGVSAAPYFLAVALCALYYLCSLPLPSSFQLASRRASAGGELSRLRHPGLPAAGFRSAAGAARRAGAGHKLGAALPTPLLLPLALSSLSPPAGSCARAGTQRAPVAQARADAALAFLLACFLPAATYAAIHREVLGEWVHFWSLLLLATGPLLFVTSLKGEGASLALGGACARCARKRGGVEGKGRQGKAREAALWLGATAWPRVPAPGPACAAQPGALPGGRCLLPPECLPPRRHACRRALVAGRRGGGRGRAPGPAAGLAGRVPGWAGGPRDLLLPGSIHPPVGALELPGRDGGALRGGRGRAAARGRRGR